MWTIVLLTLAGLACDADEPIRPAAVGEEFVLASGRTVVLAAGALQLRFARVVSDSRCPEGVQCVWQGDAEVALEARAAAGETVALRLHTTSIGGREQEAPAFGFRVRLIALEPRPRAGVERPKVHQATLLVTRD